MYGIDKSFDSRLKKALRTSDINYVDPRFLCTPGVYALHKSQEDSQPRLKFADARLRNSSIGVLKPHKSKIRLNWSHFDDPNEICATVRALSPRKVANAVQGEVERVSQEIDNRIHGRREVVEYYDDFVSRHFKDGFACSPNSGKAHGAENSHGMVAGIHSSRMQKQVMQEVAIVTGSKPIAEVRCGPYYIDIHCGRLHKNDSITAGSASLS